MKIANLINQTLRADPNASAYMAELSHQTIEVHITTLKKNFYFGFKNSEIQLYKTPTENTNATIKGPLTAFLKLALTKDPHAAARLGLTLAGDPNTLQTLQQFFSSLDIDWEELLSHWTGDIVAHKISSFSRIAQKKQKSFLKSSSQMVSEYLQEESGILPTHPEVTCFFNEVDELRAATDRLEARMSRLEEIL